MTAQLAHRTSLAKLFGAARRRRLATGAVALAAGLAGSGAVAQAATTNATGAAPSKHCVGDVSARGDVHCFATFGAAVKFVTHGRLTTAPASATAAVKNRGFSTQLNREARQAGTFIVGIMYSGANYTGSTFTWTGAGGCTDPVSDLDYYVSSMPYGWDNVVSSLKGFSNCGMKVFEYPGFGGVASDQWYFSQPYMGVLDNAASSIQWS